MVNFGNSATPGNITGQRGDSTVKASKIDTLSADERKWSENVLRVLKLPSKGAQGRVLANAVSSGAMIADDNTASQQDRQEAQALMQVIKSCGDPPWKDVQTSMRATAAAAKLNVLSIPANNRALTSPGGAGVNLSFWIERTEGDGSRRAAFLAKPMTEVALANQPAGVPHRGEVPREALSGAAAKWLAAEGIDVGMPETHVVKLPTNLFPASNYLDGAAADQVCSLQEARPSLGDLNSNTQQVQQLIRNADPKKIAKLAIFDTITINTDRHRGNVMIGQGGELIPIDHGASFVEPDHAENRGMGAMEDPYAGIERICGTMAAPHNALLAMPGAHEPLPADVLRSLKAMKTSEYGAKLKGDRDALTQEMPETARMNTANVPLVSDLAIQMSQRSARFVKMAAKRDPAPSPALIQVALGGSAMALLDPALNDNTFEANANAVLDRMMPGGETVKQFCLAGDGAYGAMIKVLEERGWDVARRGGAPGGFFPDPAMMVSLYQSREMAPTNRNARRDRLKQLATGAPASAATLQAGMRQMLQDAITRLQPHVGAVNVMQQMQTALQGLAGPAAVEALMGMLNTYASLAMRRAADRMAALRQMWQLPAASATNDVGAYEGAVRVTDATGAAEAVTRLEAAAAQGRFGAIWNAAQNAPPRPNQRAPIMGQRPQANQNPANQGNPNG